MRNVNQFKGCLIGGAVGDALGYAVEFLSASDIFRRYGENGISEYELHRGIAEISHADDVIYRDRTSCWNYSRNDAGNQGRLRRMLHCRQLQRLVSDTDGKISLTGGISLFVAGKYSRNVQSQGARKHLPGSFNPWSEWDFGGAFKSQQRLRRNYARCADWIVFLRQEI